MARSDHIRTKHSRPTCRGAVRCQQARAHRLAVNIARVFQLLKVDRAEIIETEYQTIEDNRADLVAHVWGEDGEFTLHIGIQNDNRTAMRWRMLRCRAEIGLTHPTLDIVPEVSWLSTPC